MKKLILSFLFVSVMMSFAFGQVIYDFETDETSTTFLYFGSPLDGEGTVIIDNPNPTGDNVSSKVAEYTKGIEAMTWAGSYASPQPTIDATNGGQICIDVHFSNIGNLAIKLEQSSTGGQDWITQISNTKTGEWEKLCFDLDAPSIEQEPTPGTGHIYGQIVLFFDFGVMGTTEEQLYYFDNIEFVPKEESTVIFDFETPSTTTNLTYFGGSIDGDFAKVITNPNPSGVNVSDSVAAYIKPAGSMTWAGAFCNPQPTVDVTNGGQICVDVHYDHIGVLALKLEQSSTGGTNWITTVPNTKVNEWETLCFDLDAISIEEEPNPATGNVYEQLVLFPDFGTEGGTEDQLYYLDNIVLKSSGGGNTEPVDVTFSVDMNGYSEAFTTVYVSGEFNSWFGDANPMSDDDLDGVWTTTINMIPGTYEYKFQLDQWASSEQFTGTEVCTNTTINEMGEVFTNRVGSFTGEELETVCYATCYACGASADITWNVNTALLDEVSVDGIFLAGGEFFGHGDLPAMTDEDGDGVYSITLNRELGFTTDYTFINGLCLPNWECKENIAGQDCAVMPFNDRNLPAIDGDVVINTCFGRCTDDGSCGDPAENYNATFQVDMNGETVGADGVFLSGFLINAWSPDATPMTDEDGDGIYEVTVELPENSVVEYKFVNSGEYENVALDDCTIEVGGFINRIMQMPAKDTILPAFIFGSCESTSTSTEDLDFVADLFKVQPTVSNNMVNLTWDGGDARNIMITNSSGQQVYSVNNIKGTNNLSINVSDFSKGIYLIRMIEDKKVGIQKIVVY